MPKQKYDPATSPAEIIRYLKKDSNKNTVVEKVAGQAAAVKRLEQLRKSEKEPEKYDYLWRWTDQQAALTYDLEKLNQK